MGRQKVQERVKELFVWIEAATGVAALGLQITGAIKKNPALVRAGQGLVILVAGLNAAVQFC